MVGSATVGVVVADKDAPGLDVGEVAIPKHEQNNGDIEAVDSLGGAVL